MRAAVIGGGSWGTALAAVLGNNGHEVVIWSFEADVAQALAERHENPRYMPGLPLPARVTGTHDLARALAGAAPGGTASPSPGHRAGLQQAVVSRAEAAPS